MVYFSLIGSSNSESYEGASLSCGTLHRFMFVCLAYINDADRNPDHRASKIFDEREQRIRNDAKRSSRSSSFHILSQNLKPSQNCRR